MTERLATPVVVIAFNRPDLTRATVDAVVAARPSEVFLLLDGPRPHVPEDIAKVEAVRAIFDGAAWEGTVHRRYHEQNVGCGPAIGDGLDWVFEQVERAIIVEDDCLPHPTFFRFCEEMLERYATDSRVMHISGSNYGAPRDAYLGYSYGFNAFPSIWGWATWRRAWQHYDRSMEDWPAFRDSGMVDGILGPTTYHRMLISEWNRIHGGGGTWDHQWQYTVISRHGLSVSPNVNVVSNLGFRADATQTMINSYLGALPLEPLEWPLNHPPVVAPTPLVEAHFQRTLVRANGTAVTWLRRLVPSHRVRVLMKKVLRIR